MWGNRLGWIISLALLGFTALSALAVTLLDRPSKPTQFFYEQRLDQPLSLTIDPTTVVPRPDATDATAIIREALAIYDRAPSAYERFLTQNTLSAADLQNLTAIDRIRDAGPKGIQRLFGDSPAQLIGYDSLTTPLNPVRTLGLATVRRGLLRKADEPEEAMKDFEAAFNLGARLFAERVTFQEMFIGLELMGEAAASIARLADANGDTARADAARSFDAARQAFYRDKVEPVWRVISSIDPKVVARHPGDVVAIADNAAEKMWRVEAILKLGRMRYFVGRGGRAADQRAATVAVNAFAADTDPAIRAAGQTATELTAEQYRMMR